MLFWVIMISNDRKNCVNLDLFIDTINIIYKFEGNLFNLFHRKLFPPLVGNHKYFNLFIFSLLFMDKGDWSYVERLDIRSDLTKIIGIVTLMHVYCFLQNDLFLYILQCSWAKSHETLKPREYNNLRRNLSSFYLRIIAIC